MKLKSSDRSVYFVESKCLWAMVYTTLVAYKLALYTNVYLNAVHRKRIKSESATDTAAEK